MTDVRQPVNGFKAFYGHLLIAIAIFIAGVLTIIWIGDMVERKLVPIRATLTKIEEIQRTMMYGSLPEFDYPAPLPPKRRWLQRGKQSRYVEVE